MEVKAPKFFKVSVVIDNAVEISDTSGNHYGKGSMKGNLLIDAVDVIDAKKRAEAMLIEDGEDPENITIIDVREATEAERVEFINLFG